MKKLLSVLLLVCLLLTSCSYGDVGDLTSNNDQNGGDPTAQEGSSPYGNYDYSLKPYIDDQLQYYQDKVFYVNAMFLTYMSLNELSSDIDLSKDDVSLQNVSLARPSHYTCPEGAEHGDHHSFGVTWSCPIKLGACPIFLIDCYESAGSYPILYFTFSYRYGDEIGKDADELSEPFCLYRYDSETNIRKKLIELPGAVDQMMAYGDKIYLSLGVAEVRAAHCLAVYDKNTKELKTLKVGRGRLSFISADDNYIYFCDCRDGSFYRATHGLENAEKLYTVDASYELTDASSRTLGMMVHDGYLYYRDDFKVQKMKLVSYTGEEGDQPYADIIYYDIRRLPLDSLTGDGELVAKDVLRSCQFGISGDYFYYTPIDFGVTISTGYYNMSNGRFCKVDLNTLECTDIIEKDSGLYFDGGMYAYVNGRCVIATIRPLAYPWTSRWSLNDAMDYFVLYDLKTGALYSIIKH